MNLDMDLTAYTGTYLKRMIDLNVKYGIITLLEENVREKST